MNRLFGRKKEEAPAAPAPSLQEASAKLDLSIQNLEAKIAKCDADIRANVAKGSANAAAKARAMQALKQKKQFETQKEQLLGTQFNVETLAFQQEQAEITATAVAAMQAGQAQLASQQKDMSVEKVERLMDDLQDAQEQANDINQALAAPPMGSADDEDLEAEFARLEEEATLQKLAGIGEAGAPSAVPAKAAPAAAAAPGDAEVDAEYQRLLASMGGSGSGGYAASAPSAPLPQ